MKEKKLQDTENTSPLFDIFGARICQIRQLFCNGSNREFSQMTDIDEATAAKLCTGNRGVGTKILEKIIRAFPDLDARWLITGDGTMVIDNSGDIHGNHVIAHNLVGGDMHANTDTSSDLIKTIATLTETNKQQSEQISKLIDLLSQK